MEVSLLRTGVWTIASDMATALVDRHQPQRRSRHEPINPMVEVFPCGDGRWLQLQLVADQQWQRLCEAIGCADLASDPRFATIKDRYDHGPELVALLDGVFAEAPRDEWGRRLDQAGLTWGAISELPEVVDDPQVRVVGTFAKVDHEVAGPFEVVTAPIDVSGAEIKPRGRAPDTGEHTAEVLSEIGLTGERIAELETKGVVACAPSLPSSVSPSGSEI